MPRGRGRLLSQAGIAAAQRLRNHRIVAFLGSLIAGVLTFISVPTWLHGATRFVAAYDVAALVLLGFFWFRSMHGDPRLTRARAELEDPGRNLILLVVFSAIAVGLVAAVAIVAHGPKVQNAAEKWEAYAFGVTAIVLGWLLVHTVYTFRYAHLYWFDANRDGKPGGITFPGTPEPSDIDFAYFSFTIGASFAVSDPQVTATAIRREIIGHSILSFAYNSVIIGMVINLFAGIFATPAPGGN